MMKSINTKLLLIVCFSLAITFTIRSQNDGFDFGKVSYAELDMKVYDPDTSAVAVVLDEFGEAFFDMETLNRIIFQYHVKIKVLKEKGKKYADFELVRRKSDASRFETFRIIKASSFNRDGNKWKESVLQSKNIYDDNVNSDYSLTKFAVPDVRVGSIIEVFYELESPYTFNFVPWEFQSEIPKRKSQFWAKYPAYYNYNITLKGFLQLSINDQSVMKACFKYGTTDYGSGAGADCLFYKFGIDNVPAFKVEDYMTAKRNFLSAINFELSQITHLDGRIDKITTEWKDAEKELKDHQYFGIQLKRARNIVEAKAKEELSRTSNPLDLAKNLHKYIKENYLWNGDFGIFTDNGAKKTEDLKKGNVSDINLFLLAILLEANLKAEPVLLSTRARGLPIKQHPVLSDFNYLIVGVRIADNYHLLDATSSLFPFGFIPERCLNDQGRAIWETSSWIDLKPIFKDKTSYELKLKLSPQGEISGSAVVKSDGYAAYNKRVEYFGTNKEDYVKNKIDSWDDLLVENYTIENEKDLGLNVIEKFDISTNDIPASPSIIYFQPFLFNRKLKNPFVSTERTYPVDFGAPTEDIYIVTLEVPTNYEVDELPQNVAANLPNGGGRLLVSASKVGGNVSVTSRLLLNKPIYSSEEYHYLRELYVRYISVMQSQIVLKKKS